MQHSTPAFPLPPLVEALVTLLAAHRPAFRQERTYHRACALVVAFLWTFARHTLTQCLLALGLIDADWTAFYRLFSHRRIAIPTLQLCFFRQTLRHSPLSEPYVVAADGVTFPRSSRRMPGVGWCKAPQTAPFRPGLALGQRFGALYWLPPMSMATHAPSRSGAIRSLRPKRLPLPSHRNANGPARCSPCTPCAMRSMPADDALSPSSSWPMGATMWSTSGAISRRERSWSCAPRAIGCCAPCPCHRQASVAGGGAMAQWHRSPPTGSTSDGGGRPAPKKCAAMPARCAIGWKARSSANACRFNRSICS